MPTLPITGLVLSAGRLSLDELLARSSLPADSAIHELAAALHEQNLELRLPVTLKKEKGESRIQAEAKLEGINELLSRQVSVKDIVENLGELVSRRSYLGKYLLCRQLGLFGTKEI